MSAHFRARTLRRRIGLGMLGLLGLVCAWWVSPGLPVLRGPRAGAEVKAVGLALFRHEWRPNDPMAHGDGLGPVFNARSCEACHFQGGVGGAGGGKNVTAFEVLPSFTRNAVRTGLVHGGAVGDHLREGSGLLHDLFPVIPGGKRIEGSCFVENQDLDPVLTESMNPTALFGSGWVDRISSKSITHQSLRRTVAADARELAGNLGGVPPGRARVLPDGRIGRFGWKAQFATLEEFVASACANEIGLGTPHVPQAKPLSRGTYPDVAPDLNEGQFRSLVAFVDTLPRPTEVAPSDRDEARLSARGKALFRSVGCAECHTPDLGGVAGVYSDFLLHRVADPKNTSYRETPQTPLPYGYPEPDEWKTPPLWGVADSAPYFHDGGSATIEEAVQRHHGDAERVTQAYMNLPADDRAAVIHFLKTLRAPADAAPAAEEAKGRLALAR